MVNYLAITIKEIIRSVFYAIKNQGISLSESDYKLIEENANKIIEDLIKLYKKEDNVFTRFSVTIPSDLAQASLRNRTVREFIKTINPSIEMEFELRNRALTLVDSYDIFSGEIDTFPYSMTVKKEKRPYSYNYDES